jgi:hypothetical protein
MFGVIKFCTENVSARTWTVDNQGGGDCFTISQAIQMAAPGDSISVNYGSGTYNENNPLVINKPLTIVGQKNQYNQIPTINAQNSNLHVISITGAGTKPVWIENFVITGANGLAGSSGIHSSVAGDALNKIIFLNIRVTGNSIGIYLTSTTTFHKIDDSYIYSNSGTGIVFNGMNHEIVDCGSTYQANTGIFSNGGDGIYSSSVSTSTIKDSNIYNNDQNGIVIDSGTSNTIESTEIWNNDCKGIYLSGNSNTINGLTRNIKDNYNGCVSSDLFDVQILGGSNVLRDYNIFQTSETLSGRTGVYIYCSTPQYANSVIDCNIYNYQGDDSIGIETYNSDISGTATTIHENDIGVVLGDNSMIDCDSTFSGANFYGNIDVCILVDGSGCEIKDSYLTGAGIAGYQIGIKIDNQYGGINADIDNCKLQTLGWGIHIEDSDYTDHSTIDDCEFMGCYHGIYIDSGNYDQIQNCNFIGENTGVYLDDSNQISISYSGFYNHQVGNGLGVSTKDTGIYGYSANYNTIEYCMFDGNEKGVWFDYYSYLNEISYCDIFDANSSMGGAWSLRSAEIGIFISSGSDSNDITECDLDDIRYAIGIEGSQNINIYGDTSSYSTISNCNYALYAISQGIIPSSGTISDYGSSNTVYLYGNSGSTSYYVDFDYSSLSGTWTVDITSDYYYWY